MSDFKVGDVVECVDAGNAITSIKNGEKYRIEDMSPSRKSIQVVGEWFYADRFRLIESADSINHPPHYTQHPSGVECIAITEHMNFCIGNAIKYLWRAGLKGDAAEDLKKAAWYIEREIQRIEKMKGGAQ